MDLAATAEFLKIHFFTVNKLMGKTILPPKPLPGTDFSLQIYLMRPYETIYEKNQLAAQPSTPRRRRREHIWYIDNDMRDIFKSYRRRC